MANEQNLIPSTKGGHQLTEEEAKRGTENSIKVRKEKAQFKKAIKWLAESDIKITKGKLFEMYAENDVHIKDLTPTQLATIGLWFGAVTGKSENYKVLMEGNDELKTIATTETPDINFKVIDNSHLEKTLYEHKDD